MGVVVLHRRTDWPVFRHLLPLLQQLCVPADALDAWHYFYAKEAVTYPFAKLQEPKGDRDVSEVILATGAALATSGRSLLGVPDDARLVVGFQKCIGLETGGDGAYSVRVIGARSGIDPTAIAGDAEHRATFPLLIKGDSLTVSGIVGAGGTPTVSFPSGSYAADVFQTKAGEVLVVVSPVDKAPAWTFKKDLPSL